MNPDAPYWTSEKDLPADTGWPEYDELRAAHFRTAVAEYRKMNAAKSKNESDRQQAQHDGPEQAAAGLRAGNKAPADSLPKLEARAQQLDRDADVAVRAVRQSCVDIEDVVHANRDEYHRINLGMKDTAVAETRRCRPCPSFTRPICATACSPRACAALRAGSHDKPGPPTAQVHESGEPCSTSAATTAGSRRAAPSCLPALTRRRPRTT